MKKKPAATSKTISALPKSAQTVIAELHALRSIHQDILEQYALRMNTQIVELLRALETETGTDKTKHYPSSGTLSAAAQKICALRVKPKKGRSKDLAAVKKLLKQLTELLAPPA